MDPSKRTRLVFVIGLIIVAQALLTRYFPWRRHQVAFHDGQCQQRLETLSWAISLYSSRHQGQLPPMGSPATFTAALVPITGHPEDFICPVTGAAYRPNPSLSRRQLNGLQERSTQVLIEDARPHPGHFKRVMYADFDVRRVDVP